MRDTTVRGAGPAEARAITLAGTGQRLRGAGACQPGASRAWCCGCCGAKIWSCCRGNLRFRRPRCSAWRDAFLAAGEATLKTRPADGRDAEIGRLKAKVGDLTMVNELLETKIEHPGGRAALWHGGGRDDEPPGPRPPRTAAYGILRVTRVWGISQATLYRYRR